MIDEFYIDKIDSRVVEICEKAERDFYLSKGNNRHGNYEEVDLMGETISPLTNYNQSIPHIHNPREDDIDKEAPSTDRPYRNIELAPTQIDSISHYSSKPLEVYPYHKGLNTLRQSEPKETTTHNNREPKAQACTSVEFSKENIENINNSIEMKSSCHANPINLSQNSYNSLNQSNTNRHKTLSKHNCISCDLQSKIDDKSIYHQELNKKITANKSMNTLLLNAKVNISNNNYNTAYDQLSPLIVQGLYHSDLFYLYGEVCRLLKRMEEAEDYLLLALNFKHHSPYVYYSLGLLYQEVCQYKYSNSFLKKFLIEIDAPEAHYQLAKNYHSIKQYLKSADQCTKAIILNPHCSAYYNLRSDVYFKIGLDDMAKEDINTMEGLKPKYKK